MKKTLLFLLISLWISFESVGQDRTISGKVTSAEDGSALPGVNVVVKGTTNGTVTDANGTYSVSVPSSGATIVFSFIGLTTQEIEVDGRTSVDVQMASDHQQLTEVVVTGLGWEQDKKRIGYAVEQVKVKELNQAKALNIFTGLSGKVSGLQINAINNGINPDTRVTLRGNRSLTGNNQALVVLDGIVVPSSVISSLNNNDVENITILKGATGAAIYGSDASNGVLIITSKKGTNLTPEITYSHTTQFESVSFLPKFQNGWGPGTNAYSRGYIPYENQSYGPAYDGSEVILGRELEDGTVQKTIYAANPDSKMDVWDTGVTNQNFLSFSAGDDNGKFYLSLQDVSVKGVQPRDELRRTGARLYSTRKINKLTSSFQLIYNTINVKTNASPNGFYWDVINSGSNINLMNYRNWRDFKNADGSLNFANPNNYYNDYYENPWFGLDAYRVNSNTNNLTGNFQLDYKLFDWLNVMYRAGVTTSNSYGKTSAEKFNFRAYAKDHIYRARSNYAGYVADFSNNSRNLQSDFLITANKTFGKFDGQLILGNQIKDAYSKSIGISTSNLVVPELYTVDNRTGEPTVSEYNARVRSAGFFGDLTLNYNEYLTLHLSGRNDRTSLLAKGKNSYFYPSVDVAFVLTDAIPFLTQNKVLNYAKLTAGFSRVGQVNVGPYSLDATFSPAAGFPYGSLPGFTTDNVIPSEGLEPEFTNSIEFSGEFKFFNERIKLGLGYYKQNSENQTVTISTSSAIGYPNALINAGEIENSGIEVDLGAIVLSTTSGLEVGANINYAYRSTKVVSLYQGLDEIALGNNIFAVSGQQYPVVKVDRYARDPEGHVIIDPETGYPLNDQTGLVVAGQTNPKHIIGVNPYLKYKGFEFSATAEYRTGNVIWNNTGESLTFTGLSEITGRYGRERFVFPNSVIDNGDGTYTPNTSIAVEDGGLGFWDNHFDAISENFVTSAAFWKLREVALSYYLPSSILDKAKVFKSVKIGLVGRNLLMILPKSNLYTDPEFNLGNGNAVGVNSISITPPTRTYGFTLDVTF